MFCPNCGTNLPDGSPACTNCGYQLRRSQQPAPQQSAPQQSAPQQTASQRPAYQQPAPQQPAYQQPVYSQPAPQQPVYRQPAAPVPPAAPAAYPAPISKKEYLKTKASPAAKKNAGLVTITFILSLVLVIASAVAPLAMSMFDIPVIDMIFTIAEDETGDPDELIEELEDSYKEAKREFNAEKEFLTKDEKEAGEKLLDSIEKTVDNFSILNIKSLAKVTEESAKEYDSNVDLSEMEDVVEIFDILIVGLVSFFFLPLLFALLAGLNKSTGLTVAALIFTVISQLILSGFLFVILSLVLFIFQAMLCSKINKAYQDYRVGRFAA